MRNVVKDSVAFGRQLLNGWRAKHEIWIAQLRYSDITPFMNGAKPLAVLDLANGQLRPQYKILRAQGHRVCGLDKVNCPTHNWQSRVYAMARCIYARQISTDLKNDDTLICGDVSTLPFSNQAFDLISSVAAFEHFLDVPMVLKEAHRVLRPGGLIWVLVHLFSSPSGGHNVSLSEVPFQTLPSGIDAWDHLRKRRLPFHVPLNEWRATQYLSAFGKHFEILKHYCAMREGEHLLTPLIEDELKDYDREELTCMAYIILARRSF